MYREIHLWSKSEVVTVLDMVHSSNIGIRLLVTMKKSILLLLLRVWPKGEYVKSIRVGYSVRYGSDSVRSVHSSSSRFEFTAFGTLTMLIMSILYCGGLLSPTVFQSPPKILKIPLDAVRVSGFLSRIYRTPDPCYLDHIPSLVWAYSHLVLCPWLLHSQLDLSSIGLLWR